MWSCSSPRKKTPRKNRRSAKQKTPRILSIWGRVLGVLFRYRSIWHKCAACIRRMQYTTGLGLSQQAFCNAKMAFVYTNALLATLPFPTTMTPQHPRFARKMQKKIRGRFCILSMTVHDNQTHTGSFSCSWIRKAPSMAPSTIGKYSSGQSCSLWLTR